MQTFNNKMESFGNLLSEKIAVTNLSPFNICWKSR